MPFKRFVEIGRVAYVAYGDDKGKLCVIVDVIDQNRALVDGPCSALKRKVINFKAMELTEFKLAIGHSARTKVVQNAWEKADISKKWEETSWAKKIARNGKRANLTDFDRFKLMRLKQRRNRLINIEFGKLRKAARKASPVAPKKLKKEKAAK